ncbi:hypothetical protein GALMADRAFT_908090 [Galerina marginata CBS 339.88]|uniref:Uncharacterized protein n=1 Tax=Galerina marginata (strain CBS 339.88) TaxID=685588 RepID=A0A067SPY8_GALM3|nr:hypothetical protein GALMADRAFT_908090 [Galerina marginata CBS 339.88]
MTDGHTIGLASLVRSAGAEDVVDISIKQNGQGADKVQDPPTKVDSTSATAVDRIVNGSGTACVLNKYRYQATEDENSWCGFG